MNKKLYTVIVVILAAVLFLSTVFVIKYQFDSKNQKQLYENLIATVENEHAEHGDPVQFSDDKTFIPEYVDLYARNNDMVGWIKIDDTNVNYPVVQSVDDPNFYLKRNFEKEYSDYGCPYIQENCNIEKPSDNLVIYGHNMKDGTMFSDLLKYRDKAFWEEHKTVHFNTLTDRYEYEIVAVLKTALYTESPDSFKYYQFTDAETEKDFDEYIAKCKELSLYDTGVTAEYGDKLITLSTCEYSNEHGRLVVVAKRIEGGA